MKTISFLLITAVFFFSPAAMATSLPDTEMAKLFMEGTAAYEKGDWQGAIDAFKKLVDGGASNGKLYYNLGNAYLKAGQIGNAVLWYERADKSIPGDPDLRFNLEYARTLVKDEKGETVSPVIRILFFWKFMLEKPTVSAVALVLNALFWTVLTVRALQRKKLLRTAIVLLGMLALIFTATAGFNFYESAYSRQAVILPEQVSVRSGYSERSTELFRLHSGTKVLVEKESDAYYRIRYTRDKIGWLKKTDIGIM